jgi:hypothetical protein
MIKNAKYKLKKYLSNYLLKKSIIKSTLIKNLNIDCIGNQKKILFCYLDYRSTAMIIEDVQTHSNQARYLQMIKVFIEYNFVIDVCQFDDHYAIKEIDFKKYDYILGFGDVFEAACNSETKACKIIYMTEAPFWYALKEEQKRIKYFFSRHGFYPPKKDCRAGKYYLNGQEKKADIIIFQGEKSHYLDINKNIYQVIPNAFINKNFELNNIIGKKKSNKFIMFGISNEWIRKGADLLFEVFSRHPELELYICDKDVEDQMHELHYQELPCNILNCGFVNYKSEKFIKLFTECSYILLPSSFEGMPSAIMTGMVHATIPIVTHGIGLDYLYEYCEYFDNDTILEIEKVVVDASKRNIADIENKCLKIALFAREHFTLEKFTKTFENIIDLIASNGK